MSNQLPPVPGFVDLSSAANTAADQLLAGFDNSPLDPPADAVVKTSKGVKYTRFAEAVQITHAYRTVSSKGLLDIVLGTLVRQSEKNNGRRVFFHFYKNVGQDIPEGHIAMNERVDGQIVTLLRATQLMPDSGQVRASLLNILFPEKGKPGAASLLVGKAVIVNISQVEKQARDQTTNELKFDEEGNKVMDTRDNAESFLPDEVTEEV